jgi:peroxiredoxin
VHALFWLKAWPDKKPWKGKGGDFSRAWGFEIGPGQQENVRSSQKYPKNFIRKGVVRVRNALLAMIFVFAISHGASAFELSTLDGQVLRLEELSGRIVLLHFFATWFPPCAENLAELDRAYQGLSRFMVVLPVSVSEKPETVREFLAGNGIKMPACLDPEGKMFRQFRLTHVPCTVLISAEGCAKAFRPGLTDWQAVLEGLEAKQE